MSNPTQDNPISADDAESSGEIVPVSAPAGPAHHGGLVHKSGQGYWVRVLTACGLLAILLAGCSWLWSQLEAIHVPIAGYQTTISGPSSALGEGQTLVLLNAPVGVAVIASGDEVGKASVKKTTPAGESRSTVMLTDLSLEDGRRLKDVTQVAVGSGGETRTFAVTPLAEIPEFKLVWVQGIVVGVFGLMGAWGIYWLVGRKPSSVDFFIATDAEMKKVHWSTRKNIIDSTSVVVAACFLIAGFLFLIDMLFKTIFQWLHVLESV